MKKLFSVVLSIIFLLTVVQTATVRVFAEKEGDFTYYISGTGATLSGYFGPGGDITLPAKLGGYKIDTIGKYAFYNCTSLTSININHDITEIDDNAFTGCTALHSVTFGANLQSIGTQSFSFCTALTSFSVPDGVEYIGDFAFSECTGLTSFTLGTSVDSLGKAIFYSCRNMANVYVSAGNASFSSLAGVLYDKLQKTIIYYPAGRTGPFNIPAGVETIGELAFYKCFGLTAVTIPSSVTDISFNSFYDCFDLTSVIIPDQVVSIGSRAFCNCTGLTSVTIGDSVTTIGKRAFYNCIGLTTVDIPASVVSIGLAAFYGCNQLVSVTGGENVEMIDEMAFSYCTKLSDFDMPAPITSIGYLAFSSCVKLESVTIPAGVVYLGDQAFKHCSSLVSATFLGDEPLSTGFGVFDECGSGFTVYYYSGAVGFYENWHGYHTQEMEKPLYLSAKADSMTVIDTMDETIYGLCPGLDLDSFVSDCVELNGDISLIADNAGQTLGTDTDLVVVSNDSGYALEKFDVVIYGDVNNDGNIDTNDAGTIVDLENWLLAWDPVSQSAFYEAADVNGDGNIDSNDAGILIDAENWMLSIDQTTGLAIDPMIG